MPETIPQLVDQELDELSQRNYAEKFAPVYV